MNKKQNSIMKDTSNREDDETNQLLAEWDVVRCQYCKKKVSLLDAKLVRNGNREYWVCRSCLI